ncbi:unnamed protein product [Diplocarpon coronariae]
MVPEEPLDYDVLIIGAGLSGMYSLIRMRELGLRTRVIEAGSRVGGTWYWNRYPGARFDSESVSYGFSFSPELLAEWRWTERFAGQPETERYCQFVSAKFDLGRDITFDCRVRAARFRAGSRSWEVTAAGGARFTARFLLTALGPLTAATLPDVPGVHDFAGPAFHTSRWPAGVELAGKRVAVMGTGATGIQTIQTIAPVVAHLTVIQRQPNWAKPLHNGPISAAEMARVRRESGRIFQRCAETSNGFVHGALADPRRTVEVPRAEREAFWERLYAEPGFGFVLSNYRDIHTDREANALLSAFAAAKIRARVRDPATAARLIPRNHGVGTKRLPLESGYYEVFNLPHVELVDLRDTPLERVTARGIRTTAGEHAVDVLIYATGFDAITGAFDAIAFAGVGGATLRERWRAGPQTYLGMTVPDFPNLFMIMGPHQAMGNIPPSIEYAVGWVAALLRHCRARGVTWVEPTAAQAREWHAHVQDCAAGLLANQVDSWMTGVNRNVAGRQKRIIMRYQGGILVFRRYCDQVAADQYRQMKLE